jgi:hypothetical protein
MKAELVSWLVRTFQPTRITCDDSDLFGPAAVHRMEYVAHLDGEQWALTRERVRDRERRCQQRSRRC